MDPPKVYLTPTCGLEGKLIPKPDSPYEEDEARDVYNFLGVPYAEPPFGKLRFTPPLPFSIWSGVRSATEFGAVCPQDFATLDVLPFPVPLPKSVSEDCLYLNIWTPTLSDEARLPVIVWIHGGRFRSGFSNMYDMKGLACYHNVVVVTFNYRLGIFGFMTLNDNCVTGNYGILDQIEALKWVQQYIKLFGGDPDNVTVCGQDAGGASVNLLMISRLSTCLFKRAIVQSGTVFTGDAGCQTKETAFKKMYVHMAGSMPDCPSFPCAGSEILDYLRSLPAENLVAGFKGHHFFPVLDGHVFHDSTTQLYEIGQFHCCDLLIGCNSDEGQMMYDSFVPRMVLDEKHLNVDTARTVVANVLRMLWTVPNCEAVYKHVVDHYIPLGTSYSPDDLRQVMSECFGDAFAVVPTVRAANCHSRKCNTFLYQFSHRPPCAPYPDYARASHYSEVFYALRMLDGFGIGFKENDVRMARQMATYWTHFARTGNPNGDWLVLWPQYNEITREHLVLEASPKSDKRLKDIQMDFWLTEVPRIIRP